MVRAIIKPDKHILIMYIWIILSEIVALLITDILAFVSYEYDFLKTY